MMVCGLRKNRNAVHDLLQPSQEQECRSRSFAACSGTDRNRIRIRSTEIE